MNNFFQHFQFRKLFTLIEKSKNSSLAIVTVDGYYVESFLVFSNNEEDFNEECERYLESNRYKYALNKMGMQ